MKFKEVDTAGTEV